MIEWVGGVYQVRPENEGPARPSLSSASRETPGGEGGGGLLADSLSNKSGQAAYWDVSVRSKREWGLLRSTRF